MKAPWQTQVPCRKCAAPLVVTVDAGPSEEPTLAVFYCPACGERTQVEVPAGYDALSVSATSTPPS